MSDKTSAPPGFSLRRWSQKKAEAARATPEAPPSAAAPAAVPAPDAASGVAAVPQTPAVPLPPVESLTIDSDFSAFFEPKVDEGLRRQALKQLFRDPHFNAMDGLDVYVGDYSIPDPIAPDVVRAMVQGRYIFDPPKTRVNDEGVVEDVPVDSEGAVTNGAKHDAALSTDAEAARGPATPAPIETHPVAARPSDGPEPNSR
jgi:hypothetical protein